MQTSPWLSPNIQDNSTHQEQNIYCGIYKFDPLVIGQNLPRPITPFQSSSFTNFPLQGKFDQRSSIAFPHTESPPNSEISVSNYHSPNVSVF